MPPLLECRCNVQVARLTTDFQTQEPKKQKPAIVAGKDTGEVDVDYFLIPVNIRDHEGPLKCLFPIENRLLPQGKFLTYESLSAEYTSAWLLRKNGESLLGKG